MTPAAPFDVLIVVALAWTGVLVLVSRSFLRAAVLFIAFGLLMSLAWVRLLAPDIALAEAAIGAGITGVLLIDALRHMEWSRAAGGKGGSDAPAEVRGGGRMRVMAALAAAGVFAVLAAAAHLLSDATPGLAGAVERERIEDVDHPVTAVLLVFRGFDTMLELGILALAVLGMLAVRGGRRLSVVGLAPARDPVLESVVRLLVPISIVVAGYMLWLGTFTAGGAFQAGVVLGGAGILLWITGHRSLDAAPLWLWGVLVLSGFGVFLAHAAAGIVWGEWALQYPEAHLHALVQVIEVAAAVAIGASLAALFVGLHPSPEEVGGRTDPPPPR
jgi:multisubunit Na+/H+ antiporter MnhB subunit